MRPKSMVSGATFVLACVIASSAFAQRDELDVTMRVLDDVSEIDGVLLSIDDALDSEGGDEQTTDREDGVDENDSDDGAAQDEDGDDAEVADADFDAEDDERAEGALEDRDVAEEESVDEPVEGAEEEI